MRRHLNGDRMTQHTLRVPDSLWTKALDHTDRQRTTISDVLRDALEAYVKEQDRKVARSASRKRASSSSKA